MPVSNGEPGAVDRLEHLAPEAIVAHGAERPRGEGAAMARAVFRDPPDLASHGAALQLAIARALVNAPALPIELAAFDLTLLAVAAQKRAIDLVFGKSSPIAKLRLQPAQATAGDSAGRQSAVDVSIVEVHSSMRRFEPQLRAMARRQRIRAILPAVIDRAFALGLPVRGLDGPCGPPLCAFGADRRITDLTPISEPVAGRTYLPACSACAVRHACFGVRVADAEMFGESCARPLAAAPAA